MNNLSLRITSEQCRGCGECCESFEVWYDDLYPDVVRSEMQRFQLLAGFGDKITTRREKHDLGAGTWLVFNIPCRHLNPDKSCAIYDSPDRPLLCRVFPYHNTTTDSCPKVR